MKVLNLIILLIWDYKFKIDHLDHRFPFYDDSIITKFVPFANINRFLINKKQQPIITQIIN